ncbi:MAG: hypothetical protein AB1717_09530 [Pseudomonadota bacterium]
MTDSIHQGKVLAIRLPIQDKTLLLPYSMVAEVATLSLRPKNGAFLGAVEWRGVRIPVFSIERGCGESVEILAGRVRLAVLYGVRDTAKRPYFALTLAGMPHTESLTSSQLLEATEGVPEGLCQLLGMPARLRDEAMFVPDMLELEAWMDSVEES